MTKSTYTFFFFILKIFVVPVAFAAGTSVVRNDDIQMTAENIAVINKAINAKCDEIGIFLGIDVRKPKQSSTYEKIPHWRDDSYKSGDWIIEIAKKKVLAKSFFMEKGGSVSKFGVGDVQVTLEFEFEYSGQVIYKIRFSSFLFEKNIVWGEIQRIVLPPLSNNKTNACRGEPDGVRFSI